MRLSFVPLTAYVLFGSVGCNGLRCAEGETRSVSTVPTVQIPPRHVAPNPVQIRNLQSVATPSVIEECLKQGSAVGFRRFMLHFPGFDIGEFHPIGNSIMFAPLDDWEPDTQLLIGRILGNLRITQADEVLAGLLRQSGRSDGTPEAFGVPLPSWTPKLGAWVSVPMMFVFKRNGLVAGVVPEAGAANVGLLENGSLADPELWTLGEFRAFDFVKWYEAKRESLNMVKALMGGMSGVLVFVPEAVELRDEGESLGCASTTERR